MSVEVILFNNPNSLRTNSICGCNSRTRRGECESPASASTSHQINFALSPTNFLKKIIPCRRSYRDAVSAVLSVNTLHWTACSEQASPGLSAKMFRLSPPATLFAVDPDYQTEVSALPKESWYYRCNASSDSPRTQAVRWTYNSPYPCKIVSLACLIEARGHWDRDAMNSLALTNCYTSQGHCCWSL